MDELEIEVQQLAHCKSLPVYATEGSAGLDLSLATDKDVWIAAGEIMKLPTGVIFDIPEGYFGLFVPRSGLAFRAGITLINSPGIVDSDFTSESMFLLVNHGNSHYKLQAGERLGQMIFLPYQKVKIKLVDKVESKATRQGGFGSTGKVQVVSNQDSLTVTSTSEPSWSDITTAAAMITFAREDVAVVTGVKEVHKLNDPEWLKPLLAEVDAEIAAGTFTPPLPSDAAAMESEGRLMNKLFPNDDKEDNGGKC